MSRVVVLGAGGMLGHKVFQRLADHELVGFVRRSAASYEQYPEVFRGGTLVGGVDVLEGDDLEIALREANPHYVVNCVGVVKQLEAARDPYLSVAINSLLPHRLARICGNEGSRLIHISTDCVFDGRRGDYRENDATDARDLYGRSKALGETLASESAAVTLRTSFVGRELGAPTHGLVEWFLSKQGSSVDGFENVIYSGLTAPELASVICLIVDRGLNLTGTYHVASEPINKLELLMLIRRIYNLDIEVRRRDKPASNRSLIMSRFTDVTGYSQPRWLDMVREMHGDSTPYDKWRLQESVL